MAEDVTKLRAELEAKKRELALKQAEYDTLQVCELVHRLRQYPPAS
jgi:TATA-box binding protein (TBP) (component of TFIID and TFIIIB)